MAGIKIPVQAQLDTGDVQAQLQKLNDAISGLAQNFKTMEGVKFNPVSPTTFSDIGKLKQDLSVISQRSKDFTISQSPDVRRRIRQTGQSNQDFFSIDWSRIYLDEKQRSQRLAQDYQRIVKGTSFERQGPVTFPAAPAPIAAPDRPKLPDPSGTLPGSDRPAPARPERFGLTPINQVVNAGLRSAGPVGGVVANSMNAAAGAGGIMSGAGAMAGLAGLLGGLVALGVGKIVGGVMNKIGDAEQEGIGYDTLKRQLGDVGVDFELLRSSVRNAGSAFDIAYNESLKLGQEFTKLSGFTAKNAAELGGEVQNSAGFARAFGLDPSAAVNLFAQMRKYQATENEADSRRLALMIGESVGASGSFSRIEDLMGALESFVSDQTRQSLAPANTTGYLESVAGLTSPKIPGLDLAGAASMLSRLNSTIASGGGAGEAGQNFLYQYLGRGGALNPGQVQVLQQAGAFGRPSDVLGQDSVYGRFMAQFGRSVPQGLDNQTNLERLIAGVREQYANQPPELMADALSRLGGVNITQAMALMTFQPQNLGNIEKRLAGQGLNIKDVNASSIEALARIETGDLATLQKQKDSLLARPDNEFVNRRRDELNRLSDLAEKGDPKATEALRDLLAEVTAQSGQEKTEGSETRRTIVGVSNAVQDLASQLVPSMNMARDMLIHLAGGGKKTGAELLAELRDTELSAAKDRFASERSGIKNELNDAFKDADNAQQRPFMLKNQLGAALSREADPEKREALKREYAPKIEQAEKDIAAKEARLAEIRAGQSGRMKEIDEKERRTLAGINAGYDKQVEAQQKERDIYLEQSEAAQKKNLPAPSTGVSPGTAAAPSLEGVTPEKISMRGPGGHRRASPELRRRLEAQDRALGLPIGTTEAQFSVESGFDLRAKSQAGAMGIAQIMPANVKSLSEKAGRKLDPYNLDDSLLMHKMLMEENLKKFGNPEDAMRAYNGGWKRDRWNNKETREYVPKIEQRRRAFQADGPTSSPGTRSAESVPAPKPIPAAKPSTPMPSMVMNEPGLTPMPEGASTPGSGGMGSAMAANQRQFVDIGGTLVLAGLNGQRMGEYTVPNTRVPVPSPSMA